MVSEISLPCRALAVCARSRFSRNLRTIGTRSARTASSDAWQTGSTRSAGFASTIPLRPCHVRVGPTADTHLHHLARLRRLLRCHRCQVRQDLGAAHSLAMSHLSHISGMTHALALEGSAALQMELMWSVASAVLGRSSRCRARGRQRPMRATVLQDTPQTSPEPRRQLMLAALTPVMELLGQMTRSQMRPTAPRATQSRQVSSSAFPTWLCRTTI